jgi:hypothetical protein
MYTTNTKIDGKKVVLWWDSAKQEEVEINGIKFLKILHHEKADTTSPVLLTTYSFNGFTAYDYTNGDIVFSDPSFTSAFNTSNSQMVQQKNADETIAIIKQAFKNR